MSDEPLKTEPTPPAADAAGKLTAAAKRNLRKAFGVPATDVIEQIRQFAAETHVQQCVLAKEHLITRQAHEAELKGLHKRVDGTSQWCERNEELLGRMRFNQVHEHDRLRRFEGMTFLERLRWLLWGVVPAEKKSDAVPS